MQIIQVDKSSIFIIDPIGGTGNKCACGQDAMFILGIHGHLINICETCLAKVGKTIIDGSV